MNGDDTITKYRRYDVGEFHCILDKNLW